MRGGDFEYPDQPAPHPAHLTDGAEQDIYLVDFKGSPPIKHANGHAPLVSPAGDRVVFLRKGEIWTIALRPSAKAMQLFKTRGDLASKDVVAALTTPWMHRPMCSPRRSGPRQSARYRRGDHRCS
jgi:hypothetical protein